MTHLGVALIGIVLGVSLSYLAAQHIHQFLSEATSVSAYNAYRAGKHEEAIFLLGQAVSEDPKLYEPWQLFGDIYSQEGKPDLALEKYQKALQVFDENPDRILTDSEKVPFRKQLVGQINLMKTRIKDSPQHPQTKP